MTSPHLTGEESLLLLLLLLLLLSPSDSPESDDAESEDPESDDDAEPEEDDDELAVTRVKVSESSSLDSSILRKYRYFLNVALQIMKFQIRVMLVNIRNRLATPHPTMLHLASLSLTLNYFSSHLTKSQPTYLCRTPKPSQLRLTPI
jgi:hypothetical protein